MTMAFVVCSSKTMSESQFSVLDLFCGAGGLSLGFESAGYRIAEAIDFNDAAIRTYQHRFGHGLKADLSRLTPQVSATVIVGGPPCQGFSSAGMRKAGDQRNSLISLFAQVVAQLRPRAFVFENVEGFLTAEDGIRLQELLAPLLHIGYRIHVRKVNAANYGVPQHRKRVLAIGGLGWDPTFPQPTHTAFGAPGALLASRYLPPTPTLAEAIHDLPPPTTRPPGIPQGHYFRPLKGADLKRAVALAPGMTMRDLPAELQHASYRRRAFRRVMDGTPTERRGGAPAGIRRLKPNEPSKAITGGARSEFLHHTEDRPLTLRECARLQTFPDDFLFFGTASEQGQLIGNAVPPRLAEIVARVLCADLLEKYATYDRGALLSFVPTLSDGFSPALKRITAMVNSQFEEFVQIEELSLWP